MIADNIKNIQENIVDAAKRANRDGSAAALIAVSKTKPVSMLMEAYRAGMRDFGENKVQELMDKIPLMPGDVRWHMIGHLQTNKVKYIVGKVHLIHSVDSLRLAEEISKVSVSRGVLSNILIEVNVSGEESKYGIPYEQALELVYQISKLPAVQIEGLMTIAPFSTNPEDSRVVFRKLKQLSVDILQKNIDNVCMNVLSMGMSGDYQIAVEEGATYVRVGSDIFGNRVYQ